MNMCRQKSDNDKKCSWYNCAFHEAVYKFSRAGASAKMNEWIHAMVFNYSWMKNFTKSLWNLAKYSLSTRQAAFEISNHWQLPVVPVYIPLANVLFWIIFLKKQAVLLIRKLPLNSAGACPPLILKCAMEGFPKFMVWRYKGIVA